MAKTMTPTMFNDALFCIAIMGKDQSAKIVRGWNDLVDSVERAFYGEKPTLQDRVVIVKELSNWADWVPDFSGVPFQKMTQNSDNSVFCEIIRITDASNVEVKPCA